MTFVSLALIQFIKAYNFCSDRLSLLQRPLANRWMNISIVWELALLAPLVCAPVLHAPFGTYALPLADWFIVIGLSSTILPVRELAKWIERRGCFGAMA